MSVWQFQIIVSLEMEVRSNGGESNGYSDGEKYLVELRIMNIIFE